MGVPSSPSSTCTFDWEAQDRFAGFSGDRNPMHMDAVAARRTHAGQPVVHGIHAVLWTLETLAHKGDLKQPVAEIKVRFQKIIYVGETLTIEIMRQDSAGIALHLCVDKLPVSSLNILFGEPKFEAIYEDSVGAIPPSGWPAEPVELSLNQIEQANGWLAFAQPVDAAADAFPSLAAAIGSQRVAAMAGMSRLVGMVCPGLHSTFFSLTLHTTAQPAAVNAIRYRVSSVHDQFRLVKQSVEGGGWSGTIESIARIPPVTQASMEHLAGFVQRHEFQGSNTLIIGGSRGLGELTAKLIAAGGGAVTITYAVGRDDALDVQRQILEWGGRCETIQYDATLSATDQLAQCRPALTSLYYFASASIFVRKTKLYSRAIFEKFYRIYVEGFYETCTSALDRSDMSLSVFFPSSVAIEDRPADLTEYAMAKAAGEILCADLARSNKGLRFIVKRLPRMLTDQTATVIPAKVAGPVEVMLPIVRAVEAKTNS